MSFNELKKIITMVECFIIKERKEEENTYLEPAIYCTYSTCIYSNITGLFKF
jgi:hypothetical protein